MFKKYDQRKILFEDVISIQVNKDGVNKASIIEFIQRHSLPMVVDFNHDNAQKAFRGWVDSHLLIFASRKNHSWNEIVQKGTKLARKEEFFMKVCCDHI